LGVEADILGALSKSLAFCPEYSQGCRRGAMRQTMYRLHVP
jgi:hypothetical protein